MLSPQASAVLRRPGVFAMRTLRAFRANRGLLLAGAVAYYALLSVVPLMLLLVVVLSHVIDQGELLDALGRYLELFAPGQSEALLKEVALFVVHREVIGWVLAATMVFFSSLAFSVLENAMSVIFVHRFAGRHRRFFVSALLPYCFVLFLGVALLVITVVTSGLETLSDESVRILGHWRSLEGISGVLLYLVGMLSEVVIVSAIYLVMPVGRLSWRRALIGGVVAAVLWELTRHALAWYFSSLSQVGVVYGSLTSVIVVLFSFEIAATLLLFGAQVISEYERVDLDDAPPAEPRVSA
jgi:YihY family inner membrane protein